MQRKKALKTAGFAVVAIGAVAAIGVLVIRDQISRHRRDLFSSRPWRRLAALTYLSRRDPTIDVVQLLRDYIPREPRPLLRRRAGRILERMEQTLRERPAVRGEAVG